MNEVYVVQDRGRVLLQGTRDGYAAHRLQTFSRRESPDLTLTIRLCVPSDLEAVMAMQRRVVARITDPLLYVETPREEVVESLEQDICLGAFDGERLAGFTMLLALRDTDRCLSRYLDYPEYYRRRCTTNDGTWVDPDYQGYGLQYWFSRAKDRIAAGMGASELLACVAPHNHASRRSLVKNGYAVVGQRVLYGYYPRMILSKKLPAARQET